MKQQPSRIHRPGQERPLVTVLMKNSSPEEIDAAVERYIFFRNRLARRRSRHKIIFLTVFSAILIWFFVWMITGYNVLDPKPATHTAPPRATSLLS